MKRLLCIRIYGALGLLLSMASPVYADDIGASLHRFFAQGIVYEGARAELIGIVRQPKVEGKVRWVLPRLQRHSSRFSVIAEQQQANGVRRWYVPIRVHWWAKVVTARQELPARTLLQPSMLQVARQDVADHRGVFWRSAAKLKGMQLLRPLHAHDAVFSSMVKRLPLLQRGDRVDIIAGNARFSVRTSGEVMRAAGLGEKVLVRNVRSQERIQAVVVDAHTVRVHI